MIQAEINRRFDLAVEQFQKMLASNGKYRIEGPDRTFFVDRVIPGRIQRTLEGAMARSRYVPHLSVQLNNGWAFDPTVFATENYCSDRSYCEFDYLGIEEGLLFVVDYRWGDKIDISIQAVPLEAVASIYVAYEGMLYQCNNERTSWSGNLPAIVSPAMQERRVAQ